MSTVPGQRPADNPSYRAAILAGLRGRAAVEARLDTPIDLPAAVWACCSGCGVLRAIAWLRLRSGRIVPGYRACPACGAPVRPREAEDDDDREADRPPLDPRRVRINRAALVRVAELVKTWCPAGGVTVDPLTGRWHHEAQDVGGADLVSLAAWAARCSIGQALEALEEILGRTDVA